MGAIEFESWDAVIDDIKALNAEPETSRVGLVFEDFGGGTVFAQANGNVSTYYVIVQELLKHLLSGGFICKVTLSTNERRELQVTERYVIENGNDITQLFS